MKKIPTDVDIVVDTGTLRMNAGGSVTGIVYFRFGDTAVPGEKWCDFVVCLLTWWLKSLAVMWLRIDVWRHQFRFMDDDFVVDGFCDSTGKLELAGRAYTKWPLSVDECFVVEPRELTWSLLSASEKVLDVVQAQGWTSPEISEFARTLRRARELVSRGSAVE
ncbi:MAG TPA: hypothetical protein P5242_10980 [Sedimentisphaerales bacterium]|nr:hypothetical protein [Sedimentisphaerales bacterium]